MEKKAVLDPYLDPQTDDFKGKIRFIKMNKSPQIKEIKQIRENKIYKNAFHVEVVRNIKLVVESNSQTQII